MYRDEWLPEFQDKKILIWGFGKEGKASYNLIRELLPDQIVDIGESREKGAKTLEQAKTNCVNVNCLFDDDIDFSSYDLILKSPGIVLPDGFDLSNISSETELFIKHYAKQIIGVTGSKGKSTTTSLIASALAKKYTTHLVGNIGRACFEVIPVLKEDDLIAFELGCHQLEYTRFSPHVAVILNLYEEHLDHYGTMEKYIHAKENIFRYQSDGDILILGENLEAQAEARKDAYLRGKDMGNKGHTLYLEDKELEVSDCKLLGDHNYLNMSVAYFIAHKIYGVSDDDFLAAMKEFEPLHHRIEDLGEYEGVRFVNDSISTIGQATIKALEALKDVDTVLIGGMDRGIDYQELKDYLVTRNDVHIIFMYGSGKRIFEELEKERRLSANMEYVDNLELAVERARLLTKPHHICLLSPAASSYDFFKNFEERGEIFKKLAFKL